MKKQLLLISLFLVSLSTAFAQNNRDGWSVYDVKTGQITPYPMKADKTIVGGDDRVEITGNAQGYEKAVVILEKNDKKHCSGALVGKNLVLTAAHCLSKKGVYYDHITVYAVGVKNQSSSSQNLHNVIENLRNIFQPANQGSRRTPQAAQSAAAFDRFRIPQKGTQNVQKALSAQVQQKSNYPSGRAIKMIVPDNYLSLDRTSQKYRRSSQGKYDYGILVLDTDLGEKTGWVGLTAPTTAEAENQNVNVIGLGGDKPSRTLWRSVGKIDKVEDLFVYYNADTQPGNSGGPVFFQKDPAHIIAINNFHMGTGEPQLGGYPNVGLRINKTIIDLVLQLSKK